MLINRSEIISRNRFIYKRIWSRGESVNIYIYTYIYITQNFDVFTRRNSSDRKLFCGLVYETLRVYLTTRKGFPPYRGVQGVPGAALSELRREIFSVFAHSEN